jgi:hypothetical protein
MFQEVQVIRSSRSYLASRLASTLFWSNEVPGVPLQPKFKEEVSGYSQFTEITV